MNFAKTLIAKKSYFAIFQIFTANIVKAGFGFIGSIFVLRGWSTGDIADIYTLVGVMLIFTQIGDLGTGSSFVKLVNKEGMDQEVMTQSYLGYKVVVCVGLLIVLIGSLAYYFLLDPRREVLGFAIITFASIFGVMTGFYASLLNAKQLYSSLSLTKIIPPLAKSIMIIFLFILGVKSFGWLLLAFITPAIFGALLGYYYYQYPITLKSIKSLLSSEGRLLYEMSKWVCLYSICQTTFSQIDIFMLKSMAGDNQVAQYVSAQKIATVILMLSQAVFTVMLPKMDNFKTAERVLHFNKMNFFFYLALTILMIPSTFFCSLAVSIVLGQQYLEAVPLLKIFLFQTVGGMLISTQALFFFRLDKLNWLALLSIAQLALNAAGNYYFIPNYGAEGAIWVSTVLNNLFYLLLMALTYFLVRHKT